MKRTSRPIATILGLLVLLGVACVGPKPTNDTCTAFGGTCVQSQSECAESFPYPCADGICCRPASTASAGETAPPPLVDASAD